MCLLDMAEAEDLEAELSRRKEMKVQVPMEFYLKLHQHKIINGEYLSDVVTEAIASYIDEEVIDQDGGEGDPKASGDDASPEDD